MKSHSSIAVLALGLSLSAGWSALMACRGAAAPASQVTAREIDAHLRFLSDDLLEGRSLGGRGIETAALYQESRFREYGLEPAFDGSYRQVFDLRGCRFDAQASLEVTGLQTRLPLALASDFLLKTYRQDAPEVVEAPAIYCGFLIQAPERKWDDLKGADVKGKILICEINEPGNRPGGIFDGDDMTYYGRWPYKFEKAAALGAAGCLIIHDTKGAAYGWDTLRNGWSRESFFPARYPPDPSRPGLAERRCGGKVVLRGRVRPRRVGRPGRERRFRSRPLELPSPRPPEAGLPLRFGVERGRCPAQPSGGRRGALRRRVRPL